MSSPKEPAETAGPVPGGPVAGGPQDDAGRETADASLGQSDAGSGDAGSGDDGSGDGDAAGTTGELRLAPIPPGGTAAPPDRERVFARLANQAAGTAAPANSGGGWEASSQRTPGPSGAPPSEAEVRSIRNRAKIALALGIAALLTIPLFPLGLLVGVASLAVGIAVYLAGRRKAVSAPGAVPGIVLGTVATVISCVIAVTVAVFWDEFNEYTECISGANTHSAQDKCQVQLERRLQDRLENLQ